jgi:5-methylcytosine-specific restriction endonuclease McrA
MKHRYTKEMVETAVSTSISYAQVLTKLGIIPAGGNYSVLKKFITTNNIDTKHFKGQGWNKKGINHKPSSHIPIDQYLSNQRSITSHKLRKRLLKDGIFEHKCSKCNLTEWLGEPIPLELDHIDGCNTNNNLSNLRLLCPNCHSTTPTFRRSKRSLKA